MNAAALRRLARCSGGTQLPFLADFASPYYLRTTSQPHVRFSSNPSGWAASGSSGTTASTNATGDEKSPKVETKQGPRADFKTVEASRPPWNFSSHFHHTQTVNPSWTFGSGANSAFRPPQPSKHLSIDPYAPGRPPRANYTLITSAVIPRPVAFVSTLSPDGQPNLAPFSYFQAVNHDPPLFVLGLSSPLSGPRAKDTLRNLVATRECVINLISEGFIEAANAASVDAPPDVSEWVVSGLTPVRDCVDVRCARVAEAVFAVEARLESVREFESKAVKGRKTGCLVVLEGTRFWAREDAVSEELDKIDPDILRPISRLGGISFGRTMEAFELPRPSFEKDLCGQDGYEKLARQRQTQPDAASGEK